MCSWSELFARLKKKKKLNVFLCHVCVFFFNTCIQMGDISDSYIITWIFQLVWTYKSSFNVALLDKSFQALKFMLLDCLSVSGWKVPPASSFSHDMNSFFLWCLCSYEIFLIFLLFFYSLQSPHTVTSSTKQKYGHKNGVARCVQLNQAQWLNPYAWD